jgi:hypothetical protein
MLRCKFRYVRYYRGSPPTTYSSPHFCLFIIQFSTSLCPLCEEVVPGASHAGKSIAGVMKPILFVIIVVIERYHVNGQRLRTRLLISQPRAVCIRKMATKYRLIRPKALWLAIEMKVLQYIWDLLAPRKGRQLWIG